MRLGKNTDTRMQWKADRDLRDRIAPDKAAAAEHNGDIWSRPPTQYGTILAAKIVLFSLHTSIALKCASVSRKRVRAEGCNPHAPKGRQPLGAVKKTPPGLRRRERPADAVLARL